MRLPLDLLGFFFNQHDIFFSCNENLYCDKLYAEHDSKKKGCKIAVVCTDCHREYGKLHSYKGNSNSRYTKRIFQQRAYIKKCIVSWKTRASVYFCVHHS